MIAAPDGIELIMGSRKDAVFGAVILIGMGGVAAEVHGGFCARSASPQRTAGAADARIATHLADPGRSPSTPARRPRPVARNADPLLLPGRRLPADRRDGCQSAVGDAAGRDCADARVRIDRSHPLGARPFSHLAIRPYPEDLVRQTTLRDETPVTLRPIRPEDEPLWHEMLGACSP